MVGKSKNHAIIEQVLAMDKDELERFLARLTPAARDYLDVILAKAEKNLPELKRYLDSE